MEKGINTTVENKIKEKTEAQNHINIMMQECAVMGTNDYEIPALKKLLEDLKADKLTPEEATIKATQIRFSKQEYR